MPLPIDYSIKKNEPQQFDLLPNDVYQVKVNNLELLENEPGWNGGAPSDKLNFEFVITEEGKYKNRKLWMKMRPIMSAGYSKGQASWLYKLFCAVNQVTLLDEEAKGVTASNVNELVGKEVRVTVKQKPSPDGSKTYNNITDFLPVKGNIQQLDGTHVSNIDFPEPPIEDVEPEIDVSGIPF